MLLLHTDDGYEYADDYGGPFEMDEDIFRRMFIDWEKVNLSDLIIQKIITNYACGDPLDAELIYTKERGWVDYWDWEDTLDLGGDETILHQIETPVPIPVIESGDPINEELLL